MFTNVRISVAGAVLIARNYRSDVVLEHSVSLTLARESKEVTLAMAPTFLYAMRDESDRDKFSKLSKRSKLEAIKAWVKVCHESMVYKAPRDWNQEEPNLVY